MKYSILHRKERLIITTIEIIDELGIQGLSTREIARRQDISEGALFRHFRSKNELLLAVLEYFSEFDNDIFQSTKLKNLRPRDAIIYLINSHVEYYENYPAITSILLNLDVLRYETELTDKVDNIIEKRTGYLKELVDLAQQEGEIRPDVNADNIPDIIFGFFIMICLEWKISKRKFSLKEKILSTLIQVMDSFG